MFQPVAKMGLLGNCATACAQIFSEQEQAGYVTRWIESFPKKLKGLLPSIEEIEAELSKNDRGKSGD